MLPTICGVNTGQHMYLDVGGGSFGAAMSISHTLGSASTDARFWQYRVDYIPCFTMYTPPHGCLQVWIVASRRRCKIGMAMEHMRLQFTTS